MTPYPHQVTIHGQAKQIFDKHNIVALSMEERTGKTLIAIMLAESSDAKRILILTKKKALPGWKEHMRDYATTKDYTLTNYHQLTKLKPEYDLVIFDEAHYVLSGFPKPGKFMKLAKGIAYNCRAIYLSATFSAQGFSQLYHIFATTKHSPWDSYKNFYRWVDDYVIKYQIEVYGKHVTKYDRARDSAYKDVQHLFLSYTRKDLGFKHEPEDHLHVVELEPEVTDTMEQLKKNGISDDGLIIADTSMGLMVELHKLEGQGWEKVNYIIDHWGDEQSVVIMAHYISEQDRLKTIFNNATVLSATSFAEGVDLSMFETLVIFSQGFSTAQHKQRRARQANMKRDTPINVHYLLTKKGVSAAVYKTVSVNGKNFVARYYEG